MVKSEEEWRAQLSPLEYHVAREAGTERAFTGRYWNTKTVGTYKCICCDTPLFRSDSKFESGCGWPSFFEPMEGAKLNEILDGSFGMSRTEVRCNNCDAHLGHVFPDGPPPTGLRYCINSVSLMLEPEKGESGQKEDSKEHDHAEGDGH
ncbi:MAG: peptide-methionine (R)-S-oxide reductase MsrB [Planctomycetota bacterium]|nr:peptide-methionine (R)-S-oxide reductase MsrB [Planctomycetota bacterium]